MNKYFAIGSLIAFVVWSGFMYYEGGSKQIALCAKAEEKQTIAQQAITVAAQKSVIATVTAQQTITQGVDHDYEAKESLIDNKYAAGGSVQPTSPASCGVPAHGNPTGRPHAATAPSQSVTAVFRLSAKECDENTEQLYGLQDWVRQQRAH